MVAALALFLAGLESLEPLAQDIDHPDLPTATPSIPGELRLAHAPVPLVIMVLVCLIGLGLDRRRRPPSAPSPSTSS